MYCNRCGGALNPGAQVCSACGERVLPGPRVAQPVAGAGMAVVARGRVQRHIGLLAALWMVNGILRVVEVCSFTFIGNMLLPRVFWSNSWGGWSLPFRWNAWPLSMGLAWIAILLGVFGVIHLILAWGLHERKLWARPLGLVIGFLALLRFPLGTALGIYTIWVLLPELSGREYEQIALP
jgi:hypothetical protein